MANLAMGDFAHYSVDFIVRLSCLIWLLEHFLF
jgi:hypothetical protein